MVVLSVIAWVVMGFMVLRLLVVLSNWWFRCASVPSPQLVEKSVSILIPARNEAQRLPLLLKSLHDTRDLVEEILVYNDQSEDDTSAVVRAWSAVDNRIRLIEGTSLPLGWLGKNHACHRLAKEASGHFLLFLDADVMVRRSAIEIALKQMQQKRLALLSFFPVQKMETLGEWLVVPHVNIILVSLLPLYLTWKMSWPVFAAANGQFMLFDATVYKRYWVHQRVKDIAVEDMAISRLLKKLRQKVFTGLAPKTLQCRMYQDGKEARDGIARSILFFFGGSLYAGWIYTLFTSLGAALVIMVLPKIWWAIYLMLLILLRVGVALLSGQSVWKNLLLMPFQQLMLLWLLFKGTLQYFKGDVLWKGRSLKVG